MTHFASLPPFLPSPTLHRKINTTLRFVHTVILNVRKEVALEWKKDAENIIA